MPLEDLYLAYQKKDMAEHEFVVGLKVPTPHRRAREPAVPHLQAVEAFRLGHLGRVRRVLLHRRRQRDPRAAHRVRRHGRHVEARDAR